MIDNDKIVELAALQNRLDQSSSDEDASRFESELAQLDSADMIMLRFASSLMKGRPYSVTSDNPESVSLHKSLAQHVGASIEIIEQSDGLTNIVFHPPARH